MKGRKILLISEPCPRIGDTIELVEITITEQRAVRGIFGDGKYTGYKAKDKDGNEYTCNWESFPDDSMNPMSTWYGHGMAMYDILRMYLTFEKFPAWLSNYPFISHCEKHKKLFETGSECFDCKREKKPEGTFVTW